MIHFGSVCSGIEAATVAWSPLGWKADWLSEIAPFPCALLAEKYPDVPNLGDMTGIAAKIRSGEISAPDVLCGGTPCQAFSVAGLRRSLDDGRGQLSLEFIRIFDAIDETRKSHGLSDAVCFWENVPGVLRTKDNAFGCFLAGLVGSDVPLTPGTGRWPRAGVVAGIKRRAAWRVLDAQYFGLAQRRKRVFVVASAREDFDPVAVLFESSRLSGSLETSEGQWQETSADTGEGSAGDDRSESPCGGRGDGRLTANDRAAGTLCSSGVRNGGMSNQGVAQGLLVISDEAETARTLDLNCGNPACHQGDIAIVQNVPHQQVAPTLSASASGTSRTSTQGNSLDFCIPTSCYALQENMIGRKPENGPLGSGVTENGPMYTLNASGVHGVCYPEEPSVSVRKQLRVRRLTPTECERLMGFPDGYTKIPYRGKPAEQCPDTPRYAALGNSWAVPVVRWIGERIETEINR